MRSRPHLRIARRIEDAALFESAVRCATERKGRVFIRRDKMHSEFAREGKNRGGRAQWPSQWSRQVVYGAGTENKVSRLSTGEEKSAGARQLTSFDVRDIPPIYGYLNMN